MSKEVICEVHGTQQKAYVCEHVVETLQDREPRGFFWSSNSGWCRTCEERRIEAGGDWTDDLMKKANVMLVCSGCFDEAKHINGF